MFLDYTRTISQKMMIDARVLKNTIGCTILFTIAIHKYIYWGLLEMGQYKQTIPIVQQYCNNSILPSTFDW